VYVTISIDFGRYRVIDEKLSESPMNETHIARLVSQLKFVSNCTFADPVGQKSGGLVVLVRVLCIHIQFRSVLFSVNRGQAGHGVGPLKKTKTNLFRLKLK
jgi:hypothetical protein